MDGNFCLLNLSGAGLVGAGAAVTQFHRTGRATMNNRKDMMIAGCGEGETVAQSERQCSRMEAFYIMHLSAERTVHGQNLGRHLDASRRIDPWWKYSDVTMLSLEVSVFSFVEMCRLQAPNLEMRWTIPRRVRMAHRRAKGHREISQARQLGKA